MSWGLPFHQEKNEVWQAIWEMPDHWYTTSADAIMPMTDIFWPLSFSLCGCWFVTVSAAFCFHALYNFVTAASPALKRWGAHLFERQFDFFCCSFSRTSLFIYLCCVCLCQWKILIIYRSLCSQFSSLSFSVSFVLSLSFCISSRYFPEWAVD